MKSKSKILCGSFSLLLFLFFGFSNHALAYTASLTSSSVDVSFTDMDDVNNFLIASGQATTTADFQSLYINLETCLPGYITCSPALQSPTITPVEFPFSYSQAFDYSTIRQAWLDYNFPETEAYPDTQDGYIEARFILQPYYDPEINFAFDTLILSSPNATTTTSTGAISVLDSISTAIVNTVVEFSSIIITNFWPFALAFAILAGFATAIMLFFKKITK